MRIFTRSPHPDFEEAHPHLPRPESSSARVKQRSNLGDGGYTLTSDRREMVTVAMRNGFAWVQRWELETLGSFTLRRRDFRSGSSPDVPARQRRGRSTSKSGLPELDRADLKLRNLLAG
jgi:hypothetical protein